MQRGLVALALGLMVLAGCGSQEQAGVPTTPAEIKARFDKCAEEAEQTPPGSSYETAYEACLERTPGPPATGTTSTTTPSTR